MQVMYFVTAVWSPPSVPLLTLARGRLWLAKAQQRCGGFYDLLSNAVAAVETNVGDLHGSNSDFVVIEQIVEGMPAAVEDSWWYGWDEERGYVLLDEPPTFARQRLNWAFR